MLCDVWQEVINIGLELVNNTYVAYRPVNGSNKYLNFDGSWGSGDYFNTLNELLDTLKSK